MLSTILNDVATGSSTATPATGSAALDMVAGLPAQLVTFAANLLGSLGS